MTTSERELASASPISKDRRCPVQQSSGGCPVQGKRIDPVELSEIAVHDVDIVEVGGAAQRSYLLGSGDVYGMTNTCPG